MSKERLGAAAELLRRGGTLVNESCSKCGGVQVKFSGKVVCVNCGKEEAIEGGAKEPKVASTEVVQDLKSIILSKINELLPVLRAENDPAKQEDIVRLIKHYLEVLEKIPKDK